MPKHDETLTHVNTKMTQTTRPPNTLFFKQMGTYLRRGRRLSSALSKSSRVLLTFWQGYLTSAGSTGARNGTLRERLFHAGLDEPSLMDRIS